MMKKYITKQSSIKGAGKGLFTNAFFKKGEVIGLAHVNGQPTKEVGSNHNHNEKNPTANNIKNGNKRYLIASRNLKPGEEITTNYRLQPELEQPEDFKKKKNETMTPQKDGYRTYSPFKNLPYIDVESDTIDSDNIVYDLKLRANNGLTKFIKKNTGLHTLPGAKVIREIPVKRKGGSVLRLPNKKNSKRYSRSLSATNKLFTQNFLFEKPKSRKNKVFDPNSKYYAEGGSLLTKKVTCKSCGWKWDAEDGGKDITTCHKCGGQGLVHAQDGGEQSCPEGYIYYNGQCVEWQEPEVIETDENTGYNAATGKISRDTRPGSIENNDWWKEHEDFHHLQNLAGGMSTAGFLGQRPNNTVASDQAIGDYYNRRNAELEAQTDAMIKADPNLQFIPRNKLQDFTEGFVGANALMYQDPTTVEGEARVREQQFEEDGKSIFPKKQGGGNTDAMTGMMKARLAYANEFGNPSAKRMINIPDNPYQFDNGNIGTHYMASYDNYAVPQIQDENGVLQLGDYGPESNEAIRFDSDEDANYFAKNYKNVSPGFINEKQYGGISNDYIEADLDEDEIEEYRRGGYVVEELNDYAGGGSPCGPDETIDPQTGLCIKTLYFPEVITHSDPKTRKLQGNLMEQYSQVRNAFNSARKNNSENSNNTNYNLGLGESTDTKKLPGFIKKYQNALELEKIQAARNKNTLSDLQKYDPETWKNKKAINARSAEGLATLKAALKRGDISQEDYMYAYNDWGKDKDPNVKEGIGPGAEYSQKNLDGEWNKELWADAIKGLEFGSKLFVGGMGAAFGGPAAITALSNPIVSVPLTAYGLVEGTKEFLDPNSVTRQSMSRAWDDPTASNIGNAVWDTSINALNYVGVPFLKPIGKAINSSKNLLKGGKNLINKNLINKSILYKSKNAGRNTSTGLTEADIAAAIAEEKAWTNSSAYLNRRMANTGETAQQIKNDVTKIHKRADNAIYDVNANIDTQGSMTNGIFRNPKVSVSTNALNPKQVLGHENIHLFSPASRKETIFSKNLHKNWDNPNVANLPASEKGVYANYPTIGDAPESVAYSDVADYDYNMLGHEQQTRQLNASREIAKKNKVNLNAGEELTEQQVRNHMDDFINTRKDVDYDYDATWTAEINKEQLKLANEFGTPLDVLKESNPSKYKEILKLAKDNASKTITKVLNNAWVTVPIGTAGTATMFANPSESNDLQKQKQGGITNNYIELDLTPEEIQKYKDGGYIVEEIDTYQKGGSTKLKYKKPQGASVKPPILKIMNNPSAVLKWSKEQDAKNLIKKEKIEEQKALEKAKNALIYNEIKKLEDFETLKANELKKPEHLQFLPDIYFREGSFSNPYNPSNNIGISDNTNIYRQPRTLDWRFNPKYQDNLGLFVAKSRSEDLKAKIRKENDSKIKTGPVNHDGTVETVGQFNKRQNDWEHSSYLNKLFTEEPENNYWFKPSSNTGPAEFITVGGAPKMFLQATKWVKPLLTGTKTVVKKAPQGVKYIKNATQPFRQATVSAWKAPIPLGGRIGRTITNTTAGTLTPRNLLNTSWAAESAYNQLDPNSDVVKSQSNFINNPSWYTLGDAAYETSLNNLGFFGVNKMLSTKKIISPENINLTTLAGSLFAPKNPNSVIVEPEISLTDPNASLVDPNASLVDTTSLLNKINNSSDDFVDVDVTEAEYKWLIENGYVVKEPN